MGWDRGQRDRWTEGVQARIGEAAWETGGHDVGRCAWTGRVMSVCGRVGDVAYLVTRDGASRHAFLSDRAWLERNRSVVQGMPVQIHGFLHAPGTGPRDHAAGSAIRAMLCRPVVRRTFAMGGDPRPLAAETDGRRDEILHAAPTERLRRNLWALDPMGWARGMAGPREVSEGRIRRLLATSAVPNAMAFKVLLALPEDWMPGSPETWEAFQRVTSAIAEHQGFGDGECDLATLLGSYDFLRAGRGRWAEFADRLPEGGGPAARGAVQDAVDMAMAFAGQVVVPLLHRLGLGNDLCSVGRLSPHTALAAEVLFGGKGLPAILEASRAWHGRPLAAGPEGGGADVGWPVPFPEAQSPGGIRLVPLGRPALLLSEGRTLSHCVGGYAQRCAAGTSLIVSVRDAQGASLSTAELAPAAGGRPGFRLTQHRGMRNAEPPAEAAEALAWLMGILGTPALPIDRAYAGHRWERRGGVRRPYDAMDDAALARAVGVWSGHLPRPLRDPDALGRFLAGAAARLLDTRYPRGSDGGLDVCGGLGVQALGWVPDIPPVSLDVTAGVEASIRRRLRRHLPLPHRDRAAKAMAHVAYVVGMVGLPIAVAVAYERLFGSAMTAIPYLFCASLAALYGAKHAIRGPLGRRLRMRAWRRRAALAAGDARLANPVARGALPSGGGGA